MRVFKKMVPIKDGFMKLNHDDLYLMHVYHMEPYFCDDHEAIFLYIDENEFVDLDELYCCGFKEVNQNGKVS